MGLEERSDLTGRAACALSDHEAGGVLLRRAKGPFSSVIPLKSVLTWLEPHPAPNE